MILLNYENLKNATALVLPLHRHYTLRECACQYFVDKHTFDNYNLEMGTIVEISL